MQLATLCRRSLMHHWRIGLAVLLGAAAATAVLTGALLVGDSMRGSLREQALSRLAGIEYAVIGGRFFRESLAGEIEEALGAAVAAPVILMRGSATHADTRARADRVAVIGLDERLLRVAAAEDGRESQAAVDNSRRFGAGRDRSEAEAALALALLSDDAVLLSEPLARELGAVAGADVLLRLGRPAEVSPETLLGRREEGVVTLRLTVQAVLPAQGLGALSLEPTTVEPQNAYVSLGVLQRAIGQPGQASAILLANAGGRATGDRSASLRSALAARITLGDYGLRVRVEPRYGYFALESSAVLLEPPAVDAALEVARQRGLAVNGVLAHLANRIERVAEPGGLGGEAIPYSSVVAISDASELRLVNGAPAALAPGQVLLNEWAGEQLGAGPGDRIRLTYLVTARFGRLETRAEEFELGGVVKMEDAGSPPAAGSSAPQVPDKWGAGADVGWVPDYRGITDTADIADWDPPFPVDFGAIRPIDEQYWDRYRAAPKAFVALEQGQELWTDRARPLGELTSLRLRPPGAGEPNARRDDELERAALEFEAALRAALDPQRMGLRVEAVSRRAESAALGTTDFGVLFVGLSLFLIASAAMLVTLLFRLGVERRVREIGLLLATGYPQVTVRRLLLGEGALLAGGGAVLGGALALGYAVLMLTGLRFRWADAVGAPLLRLYVTAASLTLGMTASVVIALGSIALALRGVARRPPRALLAEAAEVRSGGSEKAGLGGAGPGPRPATLVTWLVFVVACALAVALVGLSMVTGVVPQTAAFFGSGAGLLVGLLACLRLWLVCPPGQPVHRPGVLSLVRLGVRNARRNAGRSFLTAGVLACATFLITAMEVLRLQPAAGERGRRSGTGGFGLIAESVTPLLFDLNTTEGQESLGLGSEAAAAIRGQVYPLRLRPGDETSCLSLYRPGSPRIVGAPDALIARGGFEFAAIQAEGPQQEENPWLLLRRTFADGAVAAIGDEAAVVWQLDSGLGEDLEVTDERGQRRRLRFVALLRGSVLQSELIVAESRFVEMFPSRAGYGFFLIQIPQAHVAEVQAVLERGLERFGFDAQPAVERLRAYFAIQNTYLSAFQTLGGLGLLLGVLGLTAVVLRSLWERRGELALLQALGWSRVHIGGLLLAEHAALLIGGLIMGVVPAALAVAPRLAQSPAGIPWLPLAALLTAVLVTALGVAGLALGCSLRAALLTSLRGE